MSCIGDTSSESEDVEEYFGIEQPPLLQQLRRILDEYRNDVQIIKELVQNADDAGAIEMRVLYQGHTINEPIQNEKKYRKFFRAPAVAFYNDAHFEEKDWIGIRTIYTSVKADDPLKIGRFGLGFKSIFHLTDYPCIISEDRMLFIDPHEHNSNKVCVIVKLENIRINAEDCLRALDGIFGFSKETLISGKYNGTLFWFPLREAATELSEDVYNETQVQKLFDAFISESKRSLIFLKTLSRITMFIDAPKDCISSTLDFARTNFGKGKYFYKVFIENDTKSLTKVRQKVLDELKRIGRKIPEESKQSLFDVCITAKTRSLIDEPKISKSRWLIINYLKCNDMSKRMRELLEDETTCHHHLVGIAAPVSCSDDPLNVYNSTGGHIFCYQPLPQESKCVTGLPVHLNAFFALSQNRRQVKWPDQDESLVDKAMEWNLLLVLEIFPEVYCALLMQLIQICEAQKNPEHLVHSVYNLIPDLSLVSEKWTKLANKFFNLCMDKNVILTKGKVPKWVSISQAKIEPPSADDMWLSVEKLLLKDSIPLAKIPQHVMSTFEKYLTIVTPAIVSMQMQRSDTYKNMSAIDKSNLLAFVHSAKSPELLANLQLIPLEDKTYSAFENGQIVYLEDSKITELFHCHNSQFVSTTADIQTKLVLEKIINEGHFQLRYMDKMAFVNFIKETLLSNFYTDKQIDVDSSICQAWKNWSQKVWEIIQDKFHKEIRYFSTLAIFPIVESRWENAKKLKLVKLTDLLFQMDKHSISADNEQVLQSLELLSVSVVRNFPAWLDKQCVREYVYNDSFESLMRLVIQLTERDINTFNEKATLDQRQQLLFFLSETIKETPSEACLKLLRKFKIFREFDSLKKSRTKFICIEENTNVFTGIEFPVDFPTPVIITECGLSTDIAKIFNVNSINIENMIKLVLRDIDKYSNLDKERFMLWLLECEIYSRDNEIKDSAAHVAFVRVENSDDIRRPCDLFDPEDKLLRKLFNCEPHFPLCCEKYTKQVIEGFRNLGLKSKKDVTSEDLKRTCNIIHAMSLEKFPLDFEKAHALVKYLNSNTQFLDTIGMRNLCFISLSQKRIENYSANFPCRTIDHGSRFCSPSEVKSSKFSHLIGSVKILIDTKELSNLSKAFDWEKEPLIQDVVEHLAVVIKHYQQKCKSSCIEMVTNIYGWLARQEVQAVKHALKQTIAGNKFVWIGDGFLEPDYVIVEYHEDDIHLEPFIHCLPVELHEIKEFFVSIGCCKDLTFDHYIDTLDRVKDAANHEFKHMLTSTLRRLVVMILNKLKTDYAKEVRVSKKQIYFPIHTDDNSTLIMKPSQLCTFCDAQWLKDEFLTEDEEIFYVHADVPNSTAEVLGVPSLRQQILSEADAFEEWGQEEPLTRRLHNLLTEGYVDGFSVAKELFQNADDAGASKLWIMYDERENEDCCTQLLSDTMSEWQGPALWIYNDATFTDEDFVNITKLNGATKKDDLTKIGKFGLGFCAVYNVTDVPSFISREWLVIFDPHTKFLGKALPGKNPGLKINFRSIKNKKMMKRLRNQFKPYENVFGCKLISSGQPYFRGTLFRLPLRRKGSDISSHIYTKADVENLLDKFRRMSANLFIFNQNLKELKLFHLLATSQNPEEAFQTFQVSKDTIRMKTLPERLFFKHDNAVSEMETSDAPRTTIAAAVAKWKRERLLEQEPISILDKVSITVNEISNESNKHLCEATWFVSWSTAINDQTLEMAYKEQGALPLGAVAVPVMEVKSTTQMSCYSILRPEQFPDSFYKTGHFFFFLPLPVEHNFQWHINGQFSVTSDRRHLRSATQDDADTQAAQWNDCILNDAIVQSLLNLLEYLKSYSDNENYSFHQLWPKQDNALLTNCLPVSFYKFLVDSNMFSIFKGNAKWSNFANSIFLHPELRSNTRIGDLAFQMMSELAGGTNVIDIPSDVYAMLLKAADIKTRQKTIETECFLLKYFLPNLSRFEMDSSKRHKRDEILKFTLFYENLNVVNWLKVNPCMPVQGRQDLKRISDLIDPSSEIGKLFFVTDGYFPALSFDDIKIGHRLQSLGMMYTTLTDSLLIDRATSIKPLNEHCLKCAFERFQRLFCYLSDKQSSHAMEFIGIKSIPCLPIMRKPSEWPFQWRADTELKAKEIKPKTCEGHKKILRKKYIYECPSKLYASDCSNLVGCLFLIFDQPNLLGKKEKKKILCSIGVCGTEKQHIEPKFVLENLDIMSQSFRPTAKFDHHAAAKIFKDIYKFLESALVNGRIQIDDLRQLINQKSVIFVNGMFTTTDNVAQEFDENCIPFLHSIESSPLRTCSRLIQALEIKKHFQPRDFAKVLQTIYEQHVNTPLTIGLKDTCLKLLTCLYKSMVHCNVKDVYKHGVDVIYAPDCQCILRDTRTMCFNDSGDIETSDTMIYIHSDVFKNAAKAFGVKTKSIQYLLENSDDMEDFYQCEPLLTRLKRLIEGYPCDIGIFKELLQNADDAGAHEVSFLKDYTFHNSTAFLDDADDAFNPLLLGPALCVYNDSSFSQADLKGIQMLGQGSKGDDPIQTGRYGVGFNAVYNLTDVPSFLTKGDDIEGGETLCIFDPNAKYLPHVTKEKPGKRFKNISDTIRQRFGNIMSGYHENSSIFFRGGKGTMFRLPLRNVSMAQMSEIKREPINETFLTNLLNAFCEELPEIVLFLKNIRKINILTYVDGKYLQEYNITRKVSQEDIEKRQEFYQNMKLVSRNMKNKADVALFLDQKTVDYELHITEIRSKGDQSQRLYYMSEVFGFRTNAIPRIVQEKLVNGSLGLLPHGGVALELNSASSNSDSEKECKCKIFCFLPLPGITGLPVHVHGYFALDHESRRTLWSSETVECCYRSLWNCLIIKETICKAYITVLRNLKDKWFCVYTDKTEKFRNVYQCIQMFQSIFPNHASVKHFYWEELVKYFYRELVETEVHFLPVIRNIYKDVLQVSPAYLVKLSSLSWLPLKMKTDYFPAYHNEESLNDNDQNKSDFTKVLRNIGIKIVYASDTIRNSMEFAKVPLQTLEPRHVIEFLSSFDKGFSDGCTITATQHVPKTSLMLPQNANNVLRFCLSDQTGSVVKNISHIPIFLTADCVVTTLRSTEPLFVFTDNDLFDNEKHLFLHKILVKTLHQCNYRERFPGIFKQFELRDFVVLAKRSNIVKVNSDTMIPWDYINPSETWISKFWTYFRHVVKGNDIVAGLGIIEELSIIPAKENDQIENILASPRLITSLIDKNSFVIGTYLRKVLQKIRLPELNHSFFTGDLAPLVLQQIPNNSKPVEIVKCLFEHRSRITEASLSKEESNAILIYIQQHIRVLGMSSVTKQIKSLPIFWSHFGERVVLSQYSKIYAVPHMLPIDGLKELAQKLSILFLTDTFEYRDLFQLLDIRTDSIVDVYIHYLFPNEHVLTRQTFYKHIHFISNIDRKSQNRKELLDHLSELHFIERDDSKVKAKDLFNPHHPIFKAMCKTSELLPNALNNESVISLLIEVGLKNDMSIELFEQFANDIAEAGQKHGNTNNVFSNSMMLVENFFKMNSSFFESADLSKLSRIKFVVPFVVESEFEKIHRRHLSTPLISFNGSVPNDKQNVCWTVSDLLPSEADPCKYLNGEVLKKVTEMLQICTVPVFSIVKKHLENVGKSLDEKLKLRPHAIQIKTVEIVIKDIYTELNRSMLADEVSRNQLSELCSVPLVYFPYDKYILKSSNIIINCKDNEEIPPFIKKVPNVYGEYVELFLSMGASQEPCCNIYAKVLSVLAIECHNSTLLHQELDAAEKAMMHLLKHVVQTSADDIVLNVEKLYLLHKENKLCDATTLVVSNNTYFRERLDRGMSMNYSIDFNIFKEKGLLINDCFDGLSKLNNIYRPYFLTDIVQEKVCLKNISYHDNHDALLLEGFLRSRIFINGFLRLAKHAHKIDNKTWSSEIQQKLILYFQTISCKSVSGMETVLYVKTIVDGKLGHEIEVKHTNEKKSFHLEDTSSLVIYFEQTDGDWLQKINELLSVHLNKYANGCLKDEMLFLALNILKMINSPEKISEILDKNKIDEYQWEFPLESDHLRFPTPGQFVPKSLYRFLDNEYGAIYEHDYNFMALEIEDPVIDYESKDQDMTSKADSDDTKTDQTPIYIYIKIRSKKEPVSELPLLQIYDVDIGDEIISVPAYRLYKFIRNKRQIDKGTKQLCLYEGPLSDNNQSTQCLKDVFAEIRRYLKEAKDELERRRLYKRLMLQWHPDKNPNNVDFCTKVCQYILTCMQRLQDGLDLLDDEEGTDDIGSSCSSTRSDGQRSSSPWYRRYWNNFRSHSGWRNRSANSNSYYNESEDEPKSYKRRKYRRKERNRYPDFETSFMNAESEPVHYYSEAKRWQRQAESDLDNAKASLVEMTSPAFNWVCYKCHQAAEKTLKAAWYAKDANKMCKIKHSHQLYQIAQGLGSDIEQLAGQISALTGKHTRMRYPDTWCEMIPAEAYERAGAEEVVTLVNTLTEKVHSTVYSEL